MCRAFDELEKGWFRDGEQAGIQTGVALGEQKFALLVGKLLTDGRLEDLQIASVDEESRALLYEEYGLSAVALQ